MENIIKDINKTFVEDLWEKNPELLTKAVKKIFNIKEERGDSIKFEDLRNGELVFHFKKQMDVYSTTILLRDFEVYGRKINDSYMPAWMRFMYKVYGDKYAMQYISYRNKELDKYMAKYEEKYNSLTRRVLDEMGFEATKGQTK